MSERIETASQELNSALADELLQLMKEMDPFRFEQLVIDLLYSMGYGGSRKEAATVTQRSNDGGIDGVINEDRLGLNVIHVQAKRWKDNVGRNEIQNFVGALAGKKAGVYESAQYGSLESRLYRSKPTAALCWSRKSGKG